LISQHAGVPLGDAIFDRLACHLSDVILCLHQEKLTYLFINIVNATLGNGEEGSIRKQILYYFN